MYQQGSGSIERDARRMAPLVAKLLAAKNHTHASTSFDFTKYWKQSFTPEQWYPTDANIVAGTTGTNFPFDTWNFQSGGSGTQNIHLIFYPEVYVPQSDNYTIRIRAAFTGGGSANTTRITAEYQAFDTNLSSVGNNFGSQTLNTTAGGRNVVFYYDASVLATAGFLHDTDTGWLIKLGRDYDHADDIAADVHFITAVLSIEAPGTP